jgi:transglutaminase-like putative cysteine protease
MAITAAIHHVTRYRYARPVSLGPQTVRLRPAPHCRTPVLSYSLKVAPEPHFLNWQQDPHGNFLARYVFPEKVTELRIEVDLVARMDVYNPFDFFLEERAERWPFAYSDEDRAELTAYLGAPEGTGPLFEEFVRGIDRSDQQTMSFFVALNQRLQDEVRYLIRMEPGVQSPEETLRLGSGSCRDTAWLTVNIVRSLVAGAGGAVRVRVPHPAHARRPVAGRPVGPGGRLHRPARLG